MEITKDKLEKLLIEAELAHAKYEEETGEQDENWPAWYAEYIINKLD